MTAETLPWRRGAQTYETDTEFGKLQLRRCPTHANSGRLLKTQWWFLHLDGRKIVGASVWPRLIDAKTHAEQWVADQHRWPHRPIRYVRGRQ